MKNNDGAICKSRKKMKYRSARMRMGLSVLFASILSAQIVIANQNRFTEYN